MRASCSGLAADEATRKKIGDLIASAKHGAPLPDTGDVRRKLGLGQDPGEPGVMAAEYLAGWLAGKARSKKPSTYRSYEQHCRLYILPVIGHLPLERVNSGHVEQILAGVPGSAGTRARVFATLRAAMTAAAKQRRIQFSPFTGIELEPENPAEAQRWTAAEARQFIERTRG